MLHIDMIHSAVRIIGSVHDDRLVTGERREPVGTGFLVTVPSETIEGLRYGYVLTAHHTSLTKTESRSKPLTRQQTGL
jgi:hypothetical protein